MATKTLLADQGIPMVSFTSTETKNAFGTVLNQVLRGAVVAITRHDKASAVLMSVETYEALLAQRTNPLAALRADFDRRVAQMQTPKAKAGVRALFSATPQELGRAAVKATKRRG